jgi:hypothetical protein
MTMATKSQGGYHCRFIITLEISSSTELASAQQRMRVLGVSRVCLRHVDDHHRYGEDIHRRIHNQTDSVTNIHIDIDGDKKTITFPICGCNSRCYEPRQQDVKHRSVTPTTPTATAFMRILDALHHGNNRVVLREWGNGACWWNLNMNRGTRYLCGNDIEDNYPGHSMCGTIHSALDSLTTQHREGTSPAPATEAKESDKISSALSMASAEVSGYRIAKLALDSYHPCELSACIRNGGTGADNQKMNTPEVLYFSHDRCHCQHVMNDHYNIENSSPWALLSYFDNGDTSKLNKQQDQIGVEVECESLGVDTDWSFYNGVVHSATMKTSKSICPCHHFPTTMTKIRHEFGFDEPHPRHGRVPTEECLEYAMMILHDVVIPIQRYFFMIAATNSDLIESQSLVEHLQSIGWVDTKQLPQRVNSFQYHDMIVVYRSALNRLSSANVVRRGEVGKDERMDFLLSILDMCVKALGCEWGAMGKPPPLPPVLCHMDLQPQNLFFRHAKEHEMNEGTSGGEHDNHIHTTRFCNVASVMDWEEACYADPRFELLLICRKVLSNREQADELWRSYSNYVGNMSERFLLKSKGWDVGSIEPWLKLETVHSLCTLLLQAMDLLGGGRNPWETSSDLWGKIDRERRRLVLLGWHFCDSLREM